MSSTNHVKNVIIVGASGQVGSEVVKSLLSLGSFNITALTRTDSIAKFPDTVQVKKGDYTDPTFLEAAFKNQDVLVITLAAMISEDIQSTLIKAAAAAGVPWILPNEYGQDGAYEPLAEKVSILKHKERYRKEIEEFRVSKWIGVVSNLWFDFSLRGGWYGIDIANRKVDLYDEGLTPIVATTIPQVGRAIAKLLALPVSSNAGEPSISDYANNFVYIESFTVTERQMLDSVQKATGTTDADWQITNKTVKQFIQEGADKLAKGDRFGFVGMIYGYTYSKGLGDVYHGREVANEKLGLLKEDLDEVVRGVVESLKE